MAWRGIRRKKKPKVNKLTAYKPEEMYSYDELIRLTESKIEVMTFKDMLGQEVGIDEIVVTGIGGKAVLCRVYKIEQRQISNTTDVWLTGIRPGDRGKRGGVMRNPSNVVKVNQGLVVTQMLLGHM